MTSRDDGRRLLTLAGCLALIAAQVARQQGPIVRLDLMAADLHLEERWPELYPLAKALELPGQRVAAYSIALAVAAVIAVTVRAWRPLVVMALTLLSVNVVVGSVKLLTARAKPVTGELGLFDGGVMFPSGHAANAVVTWGLVCYLLARYRGSTASRRRMGAGVALAALGVGTASVYLNTHWVSDLLAGWLLGVLILLVSILIDSGRVTRPGGRTRTTGLPAQPWPVHRA